MGPGARGKLDGNWSHGRSERREEDLPGLAPA